MYSVPMVVTLIGVQCMGRLGGYRPVVVSNYLEHGWQVVPMCASSKIEERLVQRRKQVILDREGT